MSGRLSGQDGYGQQIAAEKGRAAKFPRLAFWQLQISRGNVNMNIRELMDWGLVSKVYRSGERKDLFVAEKDIWKVVKQIIDNRKKRELEPMLRLLKDVRDINIDKSNPEERAFVDTVKNIEKFAHQADKTLDKMIRADEHWFMGTFLKLFK